MKAVEFDEANVKVAESQDEYETLPARINFKTKERQVVSCWELSDEELVEVIKTKKVYLSQMTFGQPLQPVLLTAIKDEVLG